MKKYEELYTTILSMDGHEVRYFKLFAQRHIIGGSNTYIKLFDGIRTQSACNDEELRELFKKDPFVKNLPSAKLYLLRLINKSLYHFHDKEDTLSVLLRHIRLAELFFEKGNYELSESNLKKAKKLAEREEQFVFSLLISELQIKLSIYSTHETKIAEVVQGEMQYEKQVFEKYLNLREYQQASAKFKALEKKIFRPNTTSEKKQFDKILDQSIFSDAKKALSNKAQTIFYELKNSYQDKIKDNLKTQEITPEVLNFFIEYPQLFRKNAGAFIHVTDSYLQECLQNKEFAKFIEGLSKFRKLSTSSEILNAQIIFHSTLLEVNYCFLRDELTGLTTLVSQTERHLDKYDSALKTDLLLSIYHHLSYNYYLAKQYKSSLKWNIKIINRRDLKTKEELLRKANLLNLAIYYKLKDFDFLETKISSEKRRIKNQTGKYKPELLFINTLQKLYLKENSASRIISGYKTEIMQLSKKRRFEFLFSEGFLTKLL